MVHTNTVLLVAGLNRQWLGASYQWKYTLQTLKEGWDRILVHFGIGNLYLGRISLKDGEVKSVSINKYVPKNWMTAPLAYAQHVLDGHIDLYKIRKEESVGNKITRIERKDKYASSRDDYKIYHQDGSKNHEQSVLIGKDQQVAVTLDNGITLIGEISSASSRPEEGKAQFYVKVDMVVVEPPPREMTMAQLEEALGHKVKIVRRDPWSS